MINLAALLSGAAASNPKLAKTVNLDGAINVLRIAEENGVRKVFTPSSIAVMGSDAAVNGIAPLHAATYPKGSYGQSKAVLEALSTWYSANTPMQANCLRYGGVLTCNVPPSDGTTEELDRMIVAAAEFVAKDGQNLQFSDHGVYTPKIPGDIEFPMIDGKSVGLSTMLYLHTDPASIKSEEAHYHLAEYTASLNEVEALLQHLIARTCAKKGTPELAAQFQVVHDEKNYNPNKVAFAKSWPQKLDMHPAKHDWDFGVINTVGQSVQNQFESLLRQFKQQAVSHRVNQTAGEISRAG